MNCLAHALPCAAPIDQMQFQRACSITPRSSYKRIKLNSSTPRYTSRPTFQLPSLADDRQAAPVGNEDEAPAVPKVGWLWDKKSTATPRKSLKQQNIRPKKALGQHFMFDDKVLSAVASAANISAGDLVLEIGPGTGGLTRHLIDAGAHVTAVEKDYNLHDKLAEEYANEPRLKLVCGDIMRQDIKALLQSILDENAVDGEPARKVKVVANLPYNITKECLVAILPLEAQVSTMVLMLQDEVGIRLTNTKPGGPDWRAMNIIVQYYSNATYLFKVDRKRYTPPPQVHGAVIEFALRPADQKASVPDERLFLKVVKASFLQRRKLLKNSLGALFGGAETVENALIQAELPQDCRAQILGLDEFVKLSWALHEMS